MVKIKLLTLPGHVISMIYPIKYVEKTCVNASFEDQTEKIGPPQPSSLLARVGIQVRALVERHIFPVLFFTIFNMSHNHQRWTGDKDQLQCPQTDMGDGEDTVIANGGAARLETQQKEMQK